MAADVNLRPTSSKAVAGEYGKFYMLEIDVDFTVTANQLAQNEVMALFDIPADTLILHGSIEVTTADTDVSDMNLGCSTDGSTANDIIDAADVSSTGYKVNGTYLPSMYNAAQQVTLTNIDTDTINEAIIRVILFCADVSEPA